MGKMKFVTAMVPLAAIFIALSLPASAQQQWGNQQRAAPAKPAPQRAAPVQRAPVTGARPAAQQSGKAWPQQGGGTGVNRQGVGGTGGYRQGVAGTAGYQKGYAGQPAHVGRPGYAARPGFMRRSYAGRYYRGSLAWARGRWRHEWRNGRYGWWWDVGGAWYFYDRPMDGPPAFISDVEVLEDAEPVAVEGPPPDEPVAVEAYPPPAVVYPPPAVVVVPPPVVCVGPLCIR